MAGNEVTAALLKEAQQEIALLRTDLFNTRRLAEERRQAIDALQAERERLARHCDDVEASLRTANAQLNHVPELQQRCSQLESGLRKLQSELETSVAARRILQQELDDERRQRSSLAEQKALLECDRARLSKQRDDLAAQLRVAQHKAREAEEEQVRAEEDAATLRAEVAALQHAAAADTSGVGGSGLAGPPSVSGGGIGAATASTAGPSAADTAAAIAATVAAATTPLLEQLEHERGRTAALLGSLHAAKSEIIELTQKVTDYEARHTDMLARGHHDPEQLGHQLSLLREHNSALTSQLAATEERARRLEAEAAAVRAAADAAAAAAATGPPPPPPDAPSIAPRQISLAGRIQSSGSLFGGAGSEAGGGGGGDATLEDVARLRQQVFRLKASRDRLLQEIDKQWGEIERLSADNGSLTEELRAQRALAANWERQAQDSITQVDLLKDLLEDSARWGAAGAPAPAGAASAATTTATAAEGSGGGGGGTGPTVQSLQAELLVEKARATELELQLRAVAAELLRCQHSSLELGKSFLPMMAGVEKRLGELCRKARNS